MSLYLQRHLQRQAGRRNLQPRADTKEWNKMKESGKGSGRLGPGICANEQQRLEQEKEQERCWPTAWGRWH